LLLDVRQGQDSIPRTLRGSSSETAEQVIAFLGQSVAFLGFLLGQLLARQQRDQRPIHLVQSSQLGGVLGPVGRRGKVIEQTSSQIALRLLPSILAVLSDSNISRFSGALRNLLR
jgi:hypothetical protein